MNSKMSDKEALGCIFITIVTNLAPILISLVAHLLWANRFTLFVFWVFVIIGLLLLVFAMIGVIATYGNKNQEEKE